MTPPILDDDWEPPPRERRVPVFRIASVLAAVVLTFVTIRAVMATQDADRTRDPYAYARSTPEKAPAPWSPIRSPRLLADSDSSRAVASASTVLPQPARVPAPAPVRVVRQPPPIKPGYLWINSTPWAQLSVDGRVVGNTPQLGLSATPGRHELMFARDGFTTQRISVTVEPGATVRITDIALQRSAP